MPFNTKPVFKYVIYIGIHLLVEILKLGLQDIQYINAVVIQCLLFNQEACFQYLLNTCINYNAVQMLLSDFRQSFVHCGLLYYDAQ